MALCTLALLFNGRAALAQHVADNDDESPQHTAALAQIAQRSTTPQFKQALAIAVKKTGQPGTPDAEHKGIVYFTHAAAETEAFLEKLQPEIAKLKCSFVRCEMNHGIGGKPETLALVATESPWTLMWIFGTNAANYERDTAAVIKWMKEFAAECDVTFDTIGFDLCGGRFNKPPADYDALAKKMYEFCPDIVDQGAGDVAKLAAELKKSGRFFFWWD